MYIPVSHLVIVGLLVLLAVWLMVRRRGRERDLMAPPSNLRTGAAARPAAMAMTAAGLEGEVRSLLAHGNKIAAIKLVREAYQLGLAEAKDLVEAMDRGEPMALPAVHVPTPSADLEGEVRTLLVADRKIEAIKRTREQLGLGLAEAKDYVESIERRG